MQLELIEPLDGPSTWRDFLENRGEGVHHLAFMAKGSDQVIGELQAQGGILEQQGDYTGGRYSYIDMGRSLGTILELLENMPAAK